MVERKPSLLSRRDLHFLVGHHTANHHLVEMRLSPDAEYRLCKDEDETLDKGLEDCPALVCTRRKHLHLEIAVPQQIAYSSTQRSALYVRAAEQVFSD